MADLKLNLPVFIIKKGQLELDWQHQQWQCEWSWEIIISECFIVYMHYDAYYEKQLHWKYVKHEFVVYNVWFPFNEISWWYKQHVFHHSGIWPDSPAIWADSRVVKGLWSMHFKVQDNSWSSQYLLSAANSMWFPSDPHSIYTIYYPLTMTYTKDKYQISYWRICSCIFHIMKSQNGLLILYFLHCCEATTNTDKCVFKIQIIWQPGCRYYFYS